MRAKKITGVKVGRGEKGTLEIGGWLDGSKGTYIRFGLNGPCVGTLSGAQLRRLCENILKAMGPRKKRKVKGERQ